MRLLHTADWHLCDRLGKIDRTNDLRDRVERVARLCEERAADVLIVAGDLFSEVATAAEVADSFRHVREAFKPFLARGGVAVLITGNHDRFDTMELVRAGAFLADPIRRPRLEPGRVYVQSRLGFAAFTSPGGERIQFLMIPYPVAALFNLPQEYHNREEEYRRIQEKFTEYLAEVRERPDFDTAVPTVLVAHLHVRGARLNSSLFRPQGFDDVKLELADLAGGFCYAALGHIHLPQTLGGVETVRYSGPLDRLDFGEEANPTGVVLVDHTPEKTTTEFIPIEPTPFHRVTLDDPTVEAIQALEAEYPDRDRAIVRFTVTHSPACGLSRSEVTQSLRQRFPRITQIEWVAPESAAPEPPGRQDRAVSPTSLGVTETVEAYLARKTAGDPQQAELLELCREHLSGLGGRS